MFSFRLALQLPCRYAVGGYDGSTMVPSIEIYDPRLETWMIGEPMNHSRGYSAAAVLKESIYVIGGVQSNEEIVDTVCTIISCLVSCMFTHTHIYIYILLLANAQVLWMQIECYKEGKGWQTPNLRAIGKRCFSSAIVLDEC